jgi:hypothetical protein
MGALRLAAVLALVGVVAFIVIPSGCGMNAVLWVCFDPGTGHEGSYYDGNHYVNGVLDPCHCYDPCGPADTCPILIDAGPPGPGCDAGTGGAGVGDAGPDGQ